MSVNAPTEAMDTALYAKLNVASLVGSGKATGVYRNSAPQGVALPVIVFVYSLGDDDYVLGNGRGSIRLTYDVRAVVEGHAASTAGTLASTIDSLLTNGTLTVSGFTFLMGRRVRPIAYEEDAGAGKKYQHVGGEYEFMLDPT